MKLVSYQNNQQASEYRIGFLRDHRVFDLVENYHTFKKQTDSKSAIEIPADPAKFFEKGLPVVQQAKEIYQWVIDTGNQTDSYPLSEIKLGPPNHAPEKIICVGLNYADHVEEMDSEIQEYPVIFSKFNNALIGPEDAIEKSPLTEKLDYEAELVIVIGKEASQVKREDAYQYISGYTIGNDVSARDLQKRTPQWLQGKSLDRSTPIGPWVVTSDELTDPGALTVRSFVNGELRQSSATSHFIFDIPYLIEFISHLLTLKPGDLIFTGTPEGVGMGMNPQRFLQAGDQVTIEIGEIGKLENRVIDQ